MEPANETQVYLQYFGLHTDPFALTPDPAFLYLSPGHAEGLAGLKLGLYERRGLIAMIGEVGTGKTTILYSLLSGLGPNIKTAYIANTTLSFDGILRTALRDFGLPHDSAERSDLLAILNEFLLESYKKGKTVALIVDEAQNLSDSAFEELRLLSNYETYKAKLLQIILVGQPELEVKLSSNRLRQVNERIAVRCYINPLSRREARRYVDHRIRAAGGSLDLFTPAAVRLAVERSRGIPRRINILCHNALLFAYGRGMHRVTRRVMAAAAREREGGGLVQVAAPRWRRRRLDHSYGWRHSAMTWALGGAGLGIACALLVVSSPIWKQQNALRNRVPAATNTARAAGREEHTIVATAEPTRSTKPSPASPAHRVDRRHRRHRRVEASGTRPPVVSPAPSPPLSDTGPVGSQAPVQTASAAQNATVVVEERPQAKPGASTTAAASAENTPDRRLASRDRTVARPTSEPPVEAPEPLTRGDVGQPAGDQQVRVDAREAQAGGQPDAAAATRAERPTFAESASSPPVIPTEPVRTTQEVASAIAGAAVAPTNVPVGALVGKAETARPISSRVPAATAPALEAKVKPGSSNDRQPALQTVVVPRGKTLSELTLAVYGRLDRRLLRQVQDVNPSIHDPNVIRAGDALLFPALSLPQDTSRGGTRTDE